MRWKHPYITSSEQVLNVLSLPEELNFVGNT
ncbi:hypothetical protein PROAA_320032 [Candidatus Propionivibrio aalborgensis]|uniref:Uncharacterized protein n=1 Tax=Candidatus Propionivibrio aalborgensis TaxID=1860101 RepID=A0A1A8XWH5_9RHOO|nr:hypothetical protein PROAA_320032 [Candidatus Propionivibrio aalborgensis]